jgi:hypothetical protein
LNVIVTGFTGFTEEDLGEFSGVLLVEEATVLEGCFLFVVVRVGADNTGETHTAGSRLVGVSMDDGCDDGVTPHAERTMANKVRRKLDFTFECI